jgi:hypothetical protein
MDRRIRLLTISFLISCAGCVHTKAARQKFDLTPAKTSQEAFERLKVGMTVEEVETILGNSGYLRWSLGPVIQDNRDYSRFDISACYDANGRLQGFRKGDFIHGFDLTWFDSQRPNALAGATGGVAIVTASYSKTEPIAPVRDFEELQQRVGYDMTGEDLDRVLGIRPDAIVQVVGVGFERYYYSHEACLMSDEGDRLQVFKRVWRSEMPGRTCHENLRRGGPSDYESAAARLKVGLSLKQAEQRMGSKPDVVTRVGAAGTYCMWTNLECALMFDSNGLESWRRAKKANPVDMVKMRAPAAQNHDEAAARLRKHMPIETVGWTIGKEFGHPTSLRASDGQQEWLFYEVDLRIVFDDNLNVSHWSRIPKERMPATSFDEAAKRLKTGMTVDEVERAIGLNGAAAFTPASATMSFAQVRMIAAFDNSWRLISWRPFASDSETNPAKESPSSAGIHPLKDGTISP